MRQDDERRETAAGEAMRNDEIRSGGDIKETRWSGGEPCSGAFLHRKFRWSSCQIKSIPGGIALAGGENGSEGKTAALQPCRRRDRKHRKKR